MRKIKLLVVIIFTYLLMPQGQAQNIKDQTLYPPIHHNLDEDEIGQFFLVRGKKYYLATISSRNGLPKLIGNPSGTEDGLSFDFQDSTLTGDLYYGFIPFEDSKHPQPVYFRSSAKIQYGKASVSIVQLSGRYDMIGWEEKGKGTLGYRVIDSGGNMIYDGIISFKGTGPFEVDDTIIEGPFVNILSEQGAVISFKTNNELRGEVEVNDKKFKGKKAFQHEIELKGLEPNTRYAYTVRYGKNTQSYSFKTAPRPGSRTKFTFAYASDSRSGSGGGERDFGGANAYIMKKIMALNSFKNVSYMQFTGDMITGYRSRMEEAELEYANWKRSIEPFAHYFPVYTGMGNHESLNNIYFDPDTKLTIEVDKFPFETNSSEYLYAKEFVNPTNGPESEDNASYDPSPTTNDFPTYKENVYYHIYDNVATIVLNSDYWYAPATRFIQHVSGNLHGYIMDNQLSWLKNTITKLEQNDNIDHIFVTQHTPCFPNGGHINDDMWYGGQNDYRAVVGGKRLEKGIIERRDEILDILINQSSKVRAILTGDEHNYCKTEIGPDTKIYPPVYLPQKIELKRTIYQINNGAAGAPYYSQEETPWTPFTSGFTTQNAVVYFHIDGMNIEMEVLNPGTLEQVDSLKLN